MTASRLPVTAVTAVDAASRDAAVLSVQLDAPDVVVVRHDLTGAGQGLLRRVVSDGTGALEDVVVPLEHACLACAVREDLLPTLVRVAELDRWSAALLALPLASEPVPVVRGLLGMLDGAAAHRSVRQLLSLAGVVAVVDGATAEHDLFCDDLLDERDLAHGDGDARSVGEVLARQLRSADLVLAPGADARTLTLLEHLALPGTVQVDGASDLAADHLLRSRHDPRASRGWDDPRAVAPSGAPDAHGVWTLDLHDWRPAHPERLRENLEALADGRLVGRGRFWLPTRPDAVGMWDGAGGQLSIGDAGPWDATGVPVERSTRLVVTGVEEDPALVRDAFAASLLTDAELARGLARWAGRSDGFEPWLGDVQVGGAA
ncbi:GTPase, G3E family [Quadrisphaera granulorum]|uniref:G3E family GTPase n=1 Tax=Quadrisphaera granulorum TaxID=317664 RepID=A0A316AXI9_9ACTN|nr:GTP-binding protein [Quadrisphaera granulorum]PWJ54917.1 G3E family GTPase [Quadrisphaera granulorum]SZE95863.1 GTPase, G3E family [Quadrisphaera granulorum]